ncbi:MAG: tyrosine-type recombinase/integrase [Qipengyuania citrea]|nr:tyrosine-type recombinase/integrase [Citromicrobium sp.]
MVSTTLTDAKLASLKPPATGQVEVSDAVVPGLRVRIGVSGSRTFIIRKRIGGRVKTITLGRYSPRFSLAVARKKARTILSDIEAGGDPSSNVSTRKRQASGRTVRTMWPDYRLAKSDRRSIKEIERIFNRHILPHFGDRMAETITRAEITQFIDEIARNSPVMARNVLSHLSSFYGWALPRLDALPGNPCRDAGRPPAPKARDRVLNDTELGILWNLLDEEPAPFGPAIKLLILTGQRRGEVFEADRSEFDLEEKLWTIPANRAKNGVAHLVPLSDEAAKIVESQTAKDDSEKLFPARGNGANGASGFSKTMSRLRPALEEAIAQPVPRWTLHDLRRTLATGLQRLGVRLEVTEAVLNHVSGSRAGIVGVYQRHDYFSEKREALDAWAEEVLRLGQAGRSKHLTTKEGAGEG